MNLNLRFRLRMIPSQVIRIWRISLKTISQSIYCYSKYFDSSDDSSAISIRQLVQKFIYQQNISSIIFHLPSTADKFQIILFLVFIQKMGQINCCQTQQENKQLILNFNSSKIDDPVEATASENLRKSIVQNTLISKRGFKDGIDGDYIVQDPKVTEAVYNRLTNLHSLNIHESHFQVRGNEEHSYFRLRRTGVIYAGQWKNGVPNGYGKNYYPNGGIFQGSFVDGTPHGYGRFIMPNGDYYQGEVKYGRANGFGTFETDNSSYKGNFKDNVRHGQGEQKGQGYYFSGQYQYGQKKLGLYKYNGNVYQGEFADGHFSGKGKLTTTEGQYSGDFKDGEQHGYGEFKWMNGSSYRGNYYKGLREGFGQYFNSKDSSISKGIWKKGVLNGQGEYVQPRGQAYKCIWADGKISVVLQK